MKTPDYLKMNRQEFRQKVEETKANLRLVDSDAKPLAGTDITGRNQHQYVRIAIVATKDAKPRHFMLFVESNWLFDKCHELLKSPAWMRDGQWDNKWNYIEEILHRPSPGETLDQYSAMLGQDENHLWIAIYEFLEEQGALNKSVRTYTSKTFGLPNEGK